MSNIRVGVIGYGYWGPNLVRNFAELPSSTVVAVADFKPERLQRLQTIYPTIQVTNDYHNLFTMNLDAVVIATPPATHYAIARDCLEHGLNVLVEKPLTLKAEDAEDLIRIANERGLVLMVGNTFEYNSAVQMLKSIIDSGEIGDIYYVDAVRTNLGLFQPSLNCMWDLAPHDLSILLYILGEDPICVNAQGSASIFKGIQDVVYVHLQFPKNVLAHIHVSWLNPSKTRRITVVGSKKMVIYDDIENLEKIKIYDKGVDALPYTESYGDFQASYRYGDVTIPYIHFVEPLRAECGHFVESIIKHQQPRSNGVVGLRIVRILEAADRSLQDNGQPKTIAPLNVANKTEVSVANPAVEPGK